MKKILVIGGTGFIGFHVIKEALKRKWKVTSISLTKPNRNRRQKKVKYIILNLTNFKKLKKKINDNYDFVINAAGYNKITSLSESLFDSHFLGLLNLLKVLKTKKLKKFIQIGSSAEYGKATSPQRENAICLPKTSYAMAKFACTNFLQNYHRNNNFPATILRFFLVYGPNQGKNRVLPEVIESCLRNKKFATTLGNQKCDFCFIDDAIEAIFKTLFTNKSNGEVINIGYGKPLKIKDTINLVCKLIGKGQPLFGKLKYKKGTNMKLYPDIRKAKKIIGWTPKINFFQGIKKTIATYK